jgi:hypothetical protein
LIDETTLHPLTHSALISAGWYPERRVPIDHWQKYLLKEGLHWLESAEQFLTQFGGLTIEPRPNPESKFGSNSFLVDPMDDYARLDYVGFYEEIIGEDLCLLGTCGVEELIVMDRKGRVFAGYEAGFLIVLGNTVQEALEVFVRACVYPEVIYGRTAWGCAK